MATYVTLADVTQLSGQEAAVVDAIDEDEVVGDLRRLVRIPSVDGTAAEHDVQHWCAERLSELGLGVDHWEIDVRRLGEESDFPGMEVARDEAWGCVGTLGAVDRPPALILCGHVDVVPPGEPALWPDGDPFGAHLTDGVLRGRGSCDMKGGVAAILGAVSALQRCGITLRRSLAVHTVVGEEDGGLGAFATLRRGHGGDACVIAEPTAGAIVPANAGSLTFRLEVLGRPTHGSTRTSGVSALEKFEIVHEALRKLEARRNAEGHPLFDHLDLPWPIAVGRVDAGNWASSVPDRLVAEGRYGVRLDESLAEARQELEDSVRQACAEDAWLRRNPVTVTWPGGAFASGRLPAGDALQRQVEAAVVDAGAPGTPVARGAPYGSDLRQYAAAGISTLQYGPGEIRFAHGSDEHVAVADVLHCARAYALLVLRRCGAA